VLLGCRVIDEGRKGGFVSSRGGVKGLIETFLEDGENSVDSFAILGIGLGAIAKLDQEIRTQKSN
jgi:hypothetical protein